MSVYQCFFTRKVGEVAEFVVIEARDDARALALANRHMAQHDNYLSVEVFEGERRVAQIGSGQVRAPADEPFLHA